MRYLIPMMLVALLSGCGLAETATVAAAEAEDAKAAKEMQAKIEKQLQAAQQAQAEQHKAIDSAGE